MQRHDIILMSASGYHAQGLATSAYQVRLKPQDVAMHCVPIKPGGLVRLLFIRSGPPMWLSHGGVVDVTLPIWSISCEADLNSISI